MNDWQKLTQEYESNKLRLKKQKDCLPADDPQHKIYNSMITDMTYAINWMKQGHEPRIYSKAIYSKKKMEQGLEVKNRKEVFYTNDDRKLAEKAKYYDIIEGVNDVEETQLSIADMNLIQTFLTSLTEKQMECFVLNTSYNRTHEQIAVELGISKSTVQDHINFARKKAVQFQLQTERMAQ